MKINVYFFKFFLCLTTLSTFSFSAEGASFCDSPEFKNSTLCENFLKDRAEVFEEAIFSDEALGQIEEIINEKADYGLAPYNGYHLYMLYIIRGEIMKRLLGTDREICKKYGSFYNESSTEIRINYNIENVTEDGLINVLLDDLNLDHFAISKLYCKDEYDKGVNYYKNGDLERSQKHLKQALATAISKNICEKYKKKVFYYLHKIYYEKACQLNRWNDCDLEKEKNDAKQNCPMYEEQFEEVVEGNFSKEDTQKEIKAWLSGESTDTSWIEKICNEKERFDTLTDIVKANNLKKFYELLEIHGQCKALQKAVLNKI